jgi:hypothetical protein
VIVASLGGALVTVLIVAILVALFLVVLRRK